MGRGRQLRVVPAGNRRHYPEAFHLQSATALPTKSWTEVPGANPVLVAPSQTQRFYRLIRP